ncbi:hypothetical protein WICMUC_005354 [Wickerhamomyces mucosus]|uniref:Succinate dehydrogenase [ubiquinone] cytochrome b small subunit n=1 Tax=Wickerhamomyces mucosus TaxID=1378264 RepID=A0A9P8P7Y9_9ASCO|nr:hypothetical protein WICMUC_005354 [Wickerhamomyces mucosus]
MVLFKKFETPLLYGFSEVEPAPTHKPKVADLAAGFDSVATVIPFDNEVNCVFEYEVAIERLKFKTEFLVTDDVRALNILSDINKYIVSLNKRFQTFDPYVCMLKEFFVFGFCKLKQFFEISSRANEKKRIRYLSIPKFPKISLKPDLSKYKLKEQPPGYIVGSVNDATVHPDIDFFHGSYHWSYERLVAVSLVPLTITPFVTSVDLPVLDALLSTLVLMHSHIGLTSCIIDYIPKRVYGIWHTYALRFLALGSVISLYGIYVIETTDEGITSLIKKIWKGKQEQEEFNFRSRY